MRLCDSDIENLLNTGYFSIIPRPSTNHINGITVDIHLGNKFRTFNRHVTPFIDLSKFKEENNTTLDLIMSDEITLNDGEVFHLHSGELVLAITLESITLPADLVGWLDGRSSLARLGLMIHVTAHRIDPGWSGRIVLEFFNAGKLPLILRPGIMIGALSFELLKKPVLRPYNRRQNAKYQDQNNTIASRIDKDFI